MSLPVPHEETIIMDEKNSLTLIIADGKKPRTVVSYALIVKAMYFSTVLLSRAIISCYLTVYSTPRIRHPTSWDRSPAVV